MILGTNRNACAWAAAGSGIALMALAQGGAFAQQPKSGGKKGAGRAMVEPLAMDDRTGFTPIFDGSTLNGWEGNLDFWRAEGGTIVGESTPEKQLKLNTFLIWRGGKPANFELKLDYRMNSTNSGVQYRSVELPEVGKWVLKGYQADIDFTNVYTGQLYEERGRGFLAMRGQLASKTGADRPRVLGNLKPNENLRGWVKTNDWNTLHIIARGNILTHVLNGQTMSVFIDDDPAGRAMEGLLGFQMHVGPPMKIEFRNVALKTLP